MCQAAAAGVSSLQHVTGKLEMRLPVVGRHAGSLMNPLAHAATHHPSRGVPSVRLLQRGALGGASSGLRVRGQARMEKLRNCGNNAGTSTRFISDAARDGHADVEPMQAPLPRPRNVNSGQARRSSGSRAMEHAITEVIARIPTNRAHSCSGPRSALTPAPSASPLCEHVHGFKHIPNTNLRIKRALSVCSVGKIKFCASEPQSFALWLT